MCGVALVATDPLDQNRPPLTDGRDIHLPPADAAEVAARILDMVAEPDGVRRVAQAGLRTTRRTYEADAQLESLRRVLRRPRTTGRDQQTAAPGDPLVSILIRAYNGERFLKAALQSRSSRATATSRCSSATTGSTDRTPEILAAVAAEDARVRVLGSTPTSAGWRTPPAAGRRAVST